MTIHREVFGNVPGPLKVAFYTVIPLMLVWGSFEFANRMKNWERGAPAAPSHHDQERQSVARRTSAPAPTCRRCCATRPPG